MEGNAGEDQFGPTRRSILWPLLTWPHLFGIDLQTKPNASRWRDWIHASFSLACFLLNLTVHLSLMVQSRANWPSVASTRTASWNQFITNSNNFVYRVGIHLALLIRVKTHWAALRQSIGRMQRETGFVNQRRSLRISIAALCWIAVLESSQLGYAVLTQPGAKSDATLTKAAHCASNLMTIYPLMSVALFGTVAWMVIGNLASVIDQVECCRKSPTRWPYDCSILRSTTGQFGAISDCAHQLNGFFDPCLLIIVSHCFVGVINDSFHALVFFLSKSVVPWLLASSVAANIVQLWFIGYTIDRIGGQVDQLRRSLTQLHQERRLDEPQFFGLMTQIFSSPVKMSAMGFFPIDTRLIPKLVGTFLTYFIILYQFQTVELESDES